MGSYVHDSRAFRFSKTPDSQFAAPALGEHNEYVCKEFLGLTEKEITALSVEGALTGDANLPSNW